MLRLDTSEFEKGASGARKSAEELASSSGKVATEVGKAEKATSTAGKSTGAFGSSLGAASKIAGGFVLAQGLIAGPKILGGLASSARDLELQTKKANTVFGDQIGVVNDWAAANAHGMGLTKNEARDLAAGLSDLLVPMGMSREEAAQLSTKTIGLAGALSEWSGGAKSAAEVSEILTSAYLGETDGLKALGISISAADVEQRLLEKGQQDLTGAAMQQAQALAIQEMIFEKSTDAQNAYATGADSAARKQAEMTAKSKEAQQTLAMALGPAITAVTSLLLTLLVPALGFVGTAIGFLQEHSGLALAIFAAVGAAILTVLVPSFIAWAAAALPAAIATIAATAPLLLLAAGVALVIAGIILLIANWDTITAKFPILGTVADGVKAILEAFVGWITGTLIPALLWIWEKGIEPAISKSVGFVTDNWPKVQAVFEAFISWITGTLFPAIGKIYDTVSEIIGNAIGFVEDNWGKIEAAISPVMESVKTIVSTALDLIENAFRTAFGVIQGLLDVFIGIFTGDWERVKDGVLQIVNSLKDGAVEAFRAMFSMIGDLAGTAFEAARKLGSMMVDGIVSGLGEILSQAGEIGGKIREAIRSGINTALAWLHNNVRIEIGGIDPPGPGSIPGFSWGFPYLQFAKGGIVPGIGNKDSVPAMLTPGELVIPKSVVQALTNEPWMPTMYQHEWWQAQADGTATFVAKHWGPSYWDNLGGGTVSVTLPVRADDVGQTFDDIAAYGRQAHDAGVTINGGVIIQAATKEQGRASLNAFTYGLPRALRSRGRK